MTLTFIRSQNCVTANVLTKPDYMHLGLPQFAINYRNVNDTIQNVAVN